MDWSTLTGTVVGGLLGLGSGAWRERVRWRRESGDRDRDARSRLYAEYLASLATVRARLREVVRMVDRPVKERAEEARAAFAAAGMYEILYRLQLIGAPAVATEAVTVMEALHAIRNRIEEGARYPDPTYDGLVDHFETARTGLHDCMRSDLTGG